MLFVYPIAIAIYAEYNPTTIIVESELHTEQEKNKNELITILYYQTIHMSNCKQCNSFNFPACEESRGVVGAILNHNTIDKNTIPENFGS